MDLVEDQISSNIGTGDTESQRIEENHRNTITSWVVSTTTTATMDVAYNSNIHSTLFQVKAGEGNSNQYLKKR